MDKKELKLLEEKALSVRKMTIRMIGELGVGHIGGAMSAVEALTTLYYKEMDCSVERKDDPKRDKMVLSKGHAGPTLYSILADLGYFPKAWLSTLNQGGTRLPSHCDMNLTPGIDFTTGSLGQGSSAAVGLALGNRLNGYDNYTYLMVGDGELQEGQNWEAFMFAAHQKLGNLILLVDYNKLQLDGTIEDVLSLGNLSAKMESFGWHAQDIDGHSIEAISDAVAEAKEQKEKPSAIILNTRKSEGFSFGEGILGNHNMKFDKDMAEEAISILESKIGGGNQ